MADIAKRFTGRSRHPLSGSWGGAALMLAALAPVLATAGDGVPTDAPAAKAQAVATIVLRPKRVPDAPPAAGRLVAHAVTTLDLSKLSAGAFGDQDDAAR